MDKRQTKKSVTKCLILALAMISLIVFIGQVTRVNVWLCICLYWLTLTVKNFLDYRGG